LTSAFFSCTFVERLTQEFLFFFSHNCSTLFQIIHIFASLHRTKNPLKMATAMLPDINIGPSAVIAGWIEAGIAVIVVTARTYTQVKVVGRMGVEDYLMILALVRAPLELDDLSN
jgi:hypothetical protein